ncbi:hypothetical protein SASPL_153343 [Salvia splendens]|uniref:Uncharacterized protein n=1 Tax=Salvia splendens TaxID=180675 RepID=A0A8X8W5C6_SALSN|nr:hypothetical protein SASPL_153343 [Salvia splendens]
MLVSKSPEDFSLVSRDYPVKNSKEESEVSRGLSASVDDCDEDFEFVDVIIVQALYGLSNIVVLVYLFEVHKVAEPKPSIVWDFSSSMDGLNTKVLFSERDRTDQPTRLYGATKRAGYGLNVVWSAFPRLKVLEVYDISSNFDWSGLNIKSRSLESVTLHPYDAWVTGAKFDVPNIRHFNCVSTTHITHFDHFETGSDRQWDCTLDVTCDEPTNNWFVQLKHMLKKFTAPVNVSLHIHIAYEDEPPAFNFHAQDRTDLAGIKELRLLGFKEDRFPSFLTALGWYCEADTVFARGEVRPDLHLVLTHKNE